MIALTIVCYIYLQVEPKVGIMLFLLLLTQILSTIKKIITVEHCLLRVYRTCFGASTLGSPRTETLAGFFPLTHPPSLLPVMKGVAQVSKRVTSSTTTRHCYLQASKCRADRTVAGYARGREETWIHDRGWQPDRNLKTCLLLKGEN